MYSEIVTIPMDAALSYERYTLGGARVHFRTVPGTFYYSTAVGGALVRVGRGDEGGIIRACRDLDEIFITIPADQIVADGVIELLITREYEFDSPGIVNSGVTEAERITNAAIFGTVGGNPSEWRKFISASDARIRAITYINAAGGAATKLNVYRSATIEGILGGVQGAFVAGTVTDGSLGAAVGGWFPKVINGIVDIPATEVPINIIGTTGTNETRRIECDIFVPANSVVALVPVTLTAGLWRIQNIASTFVFGVEWQE